jgi:tetraacyldisaccharide 4'-kinase
MRERIQDWIESLEIYVLDVMTLRRTDAKATTVRGILYGLSVLFEGIVKIRKFLYEVRILRDTTLGVQIIAIGNLTVGGTGKTPVVEKFARELTDQNRKVAILSRGYRSKPKPLLQRILDTLLFRRESSPPKVVSDGKSLMLDSEQAGDEPFMLASTSKTSSFWSIKTA